VSSWGLDDLYKTALSIRSKKEVIKKSVKEEKFQDYLEELGMFYEELRKQLSRSEYIRLSELLRRQDKLIDDEGDLDDQTVIGSWLNSGSGFYSLEDFKDSQNNLELMLQGTARSENEEEIMSYAKAINKILSRVKAESVVKRGSQYCTAHCHGKDKGKIIHCFDTKKKAMAQHRAIQMSKHESLSTRQSRMIKTVIDGVKDNFTEIFGEIEESFEVLDMLSKAA
jgi:hypothetical protein